MTRWSLLTCLAGWHLMQKRHLDITWLYFRTKSCCDATLFSYQKNLSRYIHMQNRNLYSGLCCGKVNPIFFFFTVLMMYFVNTWPLVVYFIMVLKFQELCRDFYSGIPGNWWLTHQPHSVQFFHTYLCHSYNWFPSHLLT